MSGPHMAVCSYEENPESLFFNVLYVCQIYGTMTLLPGTTLCSVES